MKVAFDFGITNTDIVVQDNNELMFHTVPSQKIDSSIILKLLSEMNLNISQISHIAVTGGKSSDLQDSINGIPIIKINEVKTCFFL